MSNMGSSVTLRPTEEIILTVRGQATHYFTTCFESPKDWTQWKQKPQRPFLPGNISSHDTSCRIMHRGRRLVNLHRGQRQGRVRDAQVGLQY
jgi:hypothetical protein